MRSTPPFDPFSEVGDDWSRPWKIARVLEKLGMGVPDRLRRERLAALQARLGEKGIEASLVDGSPLDARPPSIEAKIRLRRARRMLFAKYEVVQQVGRSNAGMSEGFKVRATDDGAIYFLKVVPVTGNQADALRRELDAYAKLQHASGDHLLHVYGSERSDDHLGLVTEFADGGTLDDHVSKRGRLPADEAKAVALEVCAGLRELHTAGIVHRDLKPANVLRAGGRWKLGDFGISKNLSRLVTQGKTFQGYGTPEYAPPEQLVGAEAHASADVYAFGKLLAFLLTTTTDVDRIEQSSWKELVRRCAAVPSDARPSLEQIEYELTRL